MQLPKARLFMIDNEIHVAYKAPISMDVFNERCVVCGSVKQRHVADIIQFGFFTDYITSLFHCKKCGHKYFFYYEGYSRDTQTYQALPESQTEKEND
jgi:C4-type Zn-finger protein